MADKKYTLKSIDDLSYDTPAWEVKEINEGTHPILKRSVEAPSTSVERYKTPPHVGMTHAARSARDIDYGMSGPALLAAGAGKTMDDWIQGVANKAALLNLPKDPEARTAAIGEIMRRKREKAEIDRRLETNTAARWGEMLPEAAISAAVPISPGAQALTQGALSFLPSPPAAENTLGELGGSAVNSGLAGLATYGAVKGASGLGRVWNAARGNYTPAGREIMEVSDAAKRLGMPSPSVGEIDVNSVPGLIHRFSFNRPERSREMGEALKTAISGTTPTAVGPRMVTAGKLSDELKASPAELFRRSASRYEAVDDFARANGLGNMQPQGTYAALRNIADRFTPPGKTHESNPVLATLLEYDPTAFDWLRSLGANPTPRYVNQTIKDGVPLTTYHDMRVATNKAWSAFNAAARRDPTSWETRQALKDLNSLRSALDADASNWATQNVGNQQAMDLYNAANDYYKTVVAPAIIDNPFARKLTSRGRSFPTGEALVKAVTNNANKPLVDLLRPTLSQTGEDMLRVTQGLPEAASYVANAGKTAELNPTLGALGLFANSYRGPIRFVGSLVGEGGALTRAEPIKRLYAAAPLEGPARRVANAAAQYPAESLEDYLGGTLPVLPGVWYRPSE